MLVDYTNQRRAAGETIRTALIQANHARLRPILMTTIAMVVCSQLHWHRELEQDGKTVLGNYGGLISSLFLTLSSCYL
jgi:HAE1 family hydrophobic/amphiphilic exporter-1